jgi:putative nucleotidyltransferase with HDIG domain
MTDNEAQFIDVADLRLGHYIYLDLGWMAHPFALNSFKITTPEQIETLRSLGLERVRYAPALSDPAAEGGNGAAMRQFVAGAGTVSGSGSEADVVEAAAAVTAEEAAAAAAAEAQAAKQLRREQLTAQRAALQRCENQFADATRTYRQVVDTVHAQPAPARERCETMIGALVGQIGEHEESCIRLLSEKAGEKTSLHAINVTIISLLLGKVMALDDAEMLAVGVGALLHDLGKMELPDRLRWSDEHFSGAERQIYREHVAHGTALAQKMGLSKTAQLIIAQHHEMADGSGYPLKLADGQISPASRIVALVNHYDNLCNPGNPALAVTPHEALSLIYAQSKKLFDARALAMFIRMMGVYPPGSVVELTDSRYAMVVSVNSSRPLRPSILVQDAHIPAEEALILDLETQPELGIRRSLKPLQLPKAAYDYLSPRKRLCYFFERAREETPSGSEP